MALKKSTVVDILVNALFICLVVALFYYFTTQNTDRIQAQNRTYAEDCARQIATRVNDQFEYAQQLIQTYAYFLSRILKAPEVTPDILAELEKHTPFDFIRFTDLAGMNITSSGDLTPSMDREFYIRGIHGKSGMMAIFNSRVLKQSILAFYTPVYFEGRIIGVLHGAYLSKAYLREMLETSYFGQPSEVFLCNPEGRVIATTADVDYRGNILEELAAAGIIDSKTEKDAARIFKDGGGGVFNCQGASKTDNLCVMYLHDKQYVLVQTFPESITATMVENANLAGIELEMGLLILFAFYAAWLVLRGWRQRRELVRENREYSWIIDGLNILFASRYCTLDLRAENYDYIAGSSAISKKVERHGPYSELLAHHAGNIVEDEGKRDFLEFFSPHNVKKILSRNDSATYECHVRRDGRDIWENLILICLTRDNGEPTRVLFVRQDVTEMKEREERAKEKISAMHRAERQYRMAVTSNALCGFEFNVTRDLLEDPVTVNFDGKTFSLVESLGLSAPCKASGFFAALAQRALPESREAFEQSVSLDNLRALFDRGEKVLDTEFWQNDIGDGEMCVRQSIYMTKDDLVGDIMALVVERDITRQVMAQRKQTRDLQDALAMAQHANVAKSTFLSNMSHDIRTPMNAIIGFATIAAGHLDNTPQVRDCLQKVLSSSNHLLSLINDILDMSRIESGKLQLKEQECNISEIMHNLVTIIQPQTKAKKMHLFIDTFDVVNENVIADPLKLSQVFINLLSNAVKYTPAGGNITFRLSQKAAFKHGWAEYEFMVKDNGVGMSEEFVKHIFEPFSRETTATQSGIQGTGLGMAITKNIIEMMSGTVTVDTAPDMGSTFIVTLPLKTVDTKTDETKITELEGMRILVVDDDFHVCDSVDKMLKKIGMRSEWTTSGREAVYRAQLAHENHDPYLTYILDWQMPDLNGVETARRIRKAVGEDAPIIILTAYEWADIKEEAEEAGVTAFCAKPLFLSDLRQALLSTHKLLGEPEQPQAQVEQFSNVRMLVVDDVEMNREIAEFILTESGMDVETAADGTDAVEMVRKSPENYFDAILMDVQMPTMNGYEATRAIRQLRREDVKNMPIIAMTANALDEDKAMAMKSGMNDHIAKPLDIASFFEVMRKYFGHLPKPPAREDEAKTEAENTAPPENASAAETFASPNDGPEK